MSLLHRIDARTVSLGGFSVLRLLPTAACRKVGPWIFVDHFGPASYIAARESDVRPHPHCALSTVTWLFEGRIVHRDSLGSEATVHPGEIHWMRAGHGIVHSERAPAELQGTRIHSHGLQLWCAHPDGAEEQEPAFGSWKDLPELDLDGSRVQLLAGTGWGARSPVDVTSPLVYALAHLRAGESISLPDHEERCVYPVSGEIAVDGEATAGPQLLVVDGDAQRLQARTDAVVAILGGDAIGPRHMWWNLVHSDFDRLREQAERWRNGGFPSIPGDAEEFIPAPAGP